jgi:hypothetical protein
MKYYHITETLVIQMESFLIELHIKRIQWKEALIRSNEKVTKSIDLVNFDGTRNDLLDNAE